jgi:tetratricopeptide (TPR) repeat protein
MFALLDRTTSMRLNFGPLLLVLTLTIAAAAPSLADTSEEGSSTPAQRPVAGTQAGDLKQAELSLGESLREAETCGQEAAIPPTLNKLAMVYLADGEAIQAELFFMRAIDVCERLYGSDDAKVAPSLIGLGKLYVSQKNYRSAEPLLKRALKLSQKKTASADARLVDALRDLLADALDGQGKTDEATALRQQEPVITAQVLNPVMPSLVH